MAMADLKSLALRYRTQSECLGVAMFAVIAFTMLGIGARRRVGPARTEQAKIEAVSSEIASFRASFSPDRPERAAAASSLPDSLTVAVTRDARVALAERVASRAELVGLFDVRVRFAPLDSAPPPTRPDIANPAVAVADYTIAIDCAGSFASVLSLVSHLPPSVALQRLIAVRDKAGPHFRLTLAVFESAGPIQHG